MEFKKGDVVYCPTITTKPQLVETKSGVNGVFIYYRGHDFWFTTGGVSPSTTEKTTMKNIQKLFIANDPNKAALSLLYDMDFEDDGEVRLYAVNQTSFGDATDEWVFSSQEGYYDTNTVPHSKNFLENLKNHNVIITPHIEDLYDVRNSEMYYKIICVGFGSVWDWGNKIEV